MSPVFKVEGESIAGAEFKGGPFCPHRPHREAGAEARPTQAPAETLQAAVGSAGSPHSALSTASLFPFHFRTPAGLRLPAPEGTAVAFILMSCDTRHKGLPGAGSPARSFT